MGIALRVDRTSLWIKRMHERFRDCCCVFFFMVVNRRARLESGPLWITGIRQAGVMGLSGVKGLKESDF